MYLPEDNAQMYDILSELRVYAAMNALPQLAEMIDDSLVLLQAEGRHLQGKPPVQINHDGR
jgi:hypothetical protein